MNSNKKASTFCMALFILIIFSQTTTAQQNNPLINSGELIKKATDLHDQKKYKAAIEIYKQVNRSDTGYADALYEISYSSYADSQFVEAHRYATQGMELFPDQYAKFSMQAANALDDMDKAADALELYNEALKKDPQSALLYFNKGIVLIRLDREDEAKTAFQQCLLINPYYQSAHFFLGNMYLHKGNLVPAMLAYKTYLMLAPEGKYLSSTVTILSGIAKMSDEVLAYSAKKTPGKEDNFDFLQQILESKIALDKQYKLQASLEDNIVRQIQVVDEKLEYNRNDKGFAMQFYVPFYSETFKEDLFEPMIFTIFSGINLDKVESWKKKNKKKLETFANTAIAYLNQIRSTRTLFEPDRKNASLNYLYENGKYLGKGARGKGEELSLRGNWEFYHDNGVVRSKGVFNDDQKREGDWTYFYVDGTVKEKTRYRNGVEDGPSEGWYSNGNKWYSVTFREGKLNGQQTLYYFNGRLKQVSGYKDDKLEGLRKSYNINGVLSSETRYSDNKQEGLGIFYHENGAKLDEVKWSNDMAQGTYKSYFDNGKIKSQGEFTDDKRQGLWTSYYDNGNVKEKTTYLDNEITGEFTEYHENGKLSRKGNYNKKKIDGKLEDFDDDGIKYSEAVYEKGKLREVSFYDKAGKLIYNTGTRKGAATITFYDPEGIKTSEGYFNRDGNKDGKFTQYFASGKISEEVNYKDGVQDGPVITYYFNGQKKLESNYKDGKENGYNKSYYFNGKPSSEGWILDDEKQQQRIFYNQLGDVTTKEYYLNNELNGYTEYYYPGGIRDFDYKYQNGWLQEVIQYDSTGKKMHNSLFKQGNGPMIFKHYSGKNWVDANYNAYMRNGSYRLNYFDGSLSAQSFYKNDERDSIYRDYYYGGTLKTEGRYKNGNKEGLWKYYHENGKIKEEENFKAGKVNGLDKIYYPDGTIEKEIVYKDNLIEGEFKTFGDNNQLALVLYYKGGNVKSYSYEDKTGKLVAPILLKGSSGKVTGYYKNGTKSVELSFTDNDIQGSRKVFFSTGKIHIDGVSEFGYDHGVKKTYYPNGSIWKEQNFVLGNLHGTRKLYYPNGKLEKEENFYNDDLHGTCRYYDEQGKLKQTRTYYYDNLISVK